jgi:hypothetical protein
MGMMNADPFAWILEGLLAQSRHPVWRSIDRWRWRDSVFVVGLLGWIELVLIAFIIGGRASLVTDLCVGFLAVPLGALVLAEAAFAVRPTQRILASADRLVLVTVGAFLALGLAGAIAMALGYS